MKGLKEILKEININSKKYYIFSLKKASKKFGIDIQKLPFSIRILLENILRNYEKDNNLDKLLEIFKNWDGKIREKIEIPFYPARVILQDFTGVPAIVDLASMRNAMKKLGGDPKKVNPKIPSHLVIDHSVQVDYFGTKFALNLNIEKEFERNKERYKLLKWAQNSFENLKVIPPGKGIIHQVNLEYLSEVVSVRKYKNKKILIPDTLIGTDSHTTMINGIGVLGWGVGGIEAEACMLGEPIYMVFPEVIGVRLKGKLKEGVTPTDLVLYITQKLREKKVVDKFVEYFGEALKTLTVQDRATISNMSPEYGATIGFFPVDEKTFIYLYETGRDEKIIERVKKYTKENLLFYTYKEEPIYTDVIEINLEDVLPSVSGPKRPQDRINLFELKNKVKEYLEKDYKVKLPEECVSRLESEGGPHPQVRGEELRVYEIKKENIHFELKDGSIVIAAITSCTNTSNPFVLFSAGILAKKAVERGLKVKPYVKTSFAPGSLVVKEYLEKGGLLTYLEALGFFIVGYGCTTCIGNSGPLVPGVERIIKEKNLVVTSVLSGNRNFEARVHPLVKMNFLASPPLVVAFAIKGDILFNPYKEPLGLDPNDNPVYLKDIWPSEEEVFDYMKKFLSREYYKKVYSEIYKGNELWEKLESPKGTLFEFEEDSTYIREAPFFEDFKPTPSPIKDIKNARVLLLLGDSITTDHISPAGKIPEDSPAGKYLISKGVKREEFNTFGARRGNHEIMIRGTFGNVRLKNKLIPDREGFWTIKFPEKEVLTIYDAAMKYMEEGVPLIVIAGKEYGSGSSRDWAAKGTKLLSIKAIIAESFERIHRQNLIQMGVIPIQFEEGQNASTLNLTGEEIYFIEGLEEDLKPNKKVKIKAKKDDREIVFNGILRIDTWKEIEYLKYGGILPYVLKNFLKGE
ncbi:MAG: aconitate hydratase AcnA [candidate division WOR-3 bacterium]